MASLLLLALVAGIAYAAWLSWPLRSNANLRERRLLPPNEWLATFDVPSHRRDDIHKITELVAAVLQVDRSTLRGNDAIWGDLFVPCYSFWGRHDERWEYLMAALAEYVGRMRGFEITDAESPRCYRWTTLSHLVSDVAEMASMPRVS